MGSFYHIYIKRKAGSTLEAVEAKMNLATDWYRYGTNIYIVYTTSDANKWYGRLEPLVKPDGRVFICKLDTTSRQGWMHKDFWTWLKQERSTT